MPLEVYGINISAPCRVLLMTCDTVGVKYDFKLVDLTKGDQMKPEYLKINPQHNIPTLKDGSLCMNESRAAATYVVSKYGKDDKLYPKDLQARAIVDQRLYFDMGTFYKAFGEIVYPILFGKPAPGKDKYDRFTEVMGWVNDMIKPTGYVANTDHLTVADISFAATFATILATEHFDTSAYKETLAWYDKVKGEIPNFDKINVEGAARFGGWFKNASQKQ